MLIQMTRMIERVEGSGLFVRGLLCRLTKTILSVLEIEDRSFPGFGFGYPLACRCFLSFMEIPLNVRVNG